MPYVLHREVIKWRRPTKQTFYVATPILFVLVSATSEAEARELGQSALDDLYRRRLKRLVTADIRIVRPATDAEIALDNRFRRAQLRRRALPSFAQLLSQVGGTVRKQYL